ncbi:MAG: hypothetical protein RSE54_10010, partial [Ruthenibacterium sp.]
MADAYLCRASGGAKIKLLWENASPTSAFPAQTIKVDLSKYDYIIVTFAWRYPLAIAPIVAKVGETARSSAYVNGYYVSRDILAINWDGITYDNGYN